MFVFLWIVWSSLVGYTSICDSQTRNGISADSRHHSLSKIENTHFFWIFGAVFSKRLFCSSKFVICFCSFYKSDYELIIFFFALAVLKFCRRNNDSFLLFPDIKIVQIIYYSVRISWSTKSRNYIYNISFLAKHFPRIAARILGKSTPAPHEK